MIREDITHALPEGVGQPLWSQLLTAEGSSGWIRAGDIRRVGDELHFEPLCPWDGRAFEILWQAATSSTVPAEREDRIVFGIRDAGTVRKLAEVTLGSRVRRDTSLAWRQGRGQRRRLLYGAKDAR
jgi:hypothetical protein